MKTKTELLKQLEERIGNHYFECLSFCSVLNMLRSEIRFSDKVEEELDKLFELIRLEAEEELKNDR